MHKDSHYVEKALNGDLDAFDALVHKYKDRTYRMVMRMIPHPEDAKDITQEVFILVYRHLHQFHLDKRFSSWLYQITVNRCLDELRKRKGKQTVTINEDWINDDATPESQLIEREGLQAAVDHHLSLLPPQHRAVFLLRYVDDLSYGEISEVLGITTTQVRNILYRARQKLKERRALKEGIQG
ncbi:hypothetical protein ADL26_05820 [Thermoactinomyces vulgaris]|jgi:RNA polymerase sigma-70 factor, ECF subfamily|nr:hypothetical protein ADL26_05820 [Thermoactinomyces vulgaris]